jgi:adenosine deaminase
VPETHKASRSPSTPSPTPASASSRTSPAPLPEPIAHGLFVTLNSDDPAYFGGYLNENYQSVAEAFGLNRETLCTLARNSFEASFLDDANKAEFFAKVDAYRINAPA